MIGSRTRRTFTQQGRKLNFETLETRRLLISEGAPFELDIVADSSGLLGSISAVADWGDGNRTTLTRENAPETGQLRAVIDYRFAGTAFTDEMKTVLQAAADTLVSRFGDTLDAIQPSGTNRWTAEFRNPSTGETESLPNLRIAQNEIRIFVGMRDLPNGVLGEAGPGGASGISGTTAFRETVRARGQSGALAARPTDFGPWGGQVSFDSETNWYTGSDPEGASRDQQDLYTVALHELAHVLGFGISLRDQGAWTSWDTLVSGNRFRGQKTAQFYDGSGFVPLDSTNAHFAPDVEDEGQLAVLVPILPRSARRFFTRLDFASLEDIGWEFLDASVRFTGSNAYGDNKRFPISITVRGSRFGPNKQIERNALISNVAPELESIADREAEVGRSILVTNIGRFSDPGFGTEDATPPTQETFSYSIDWGDGSPLDEGEATIDRLGSTGITTIGSFDGRHTYDREGRFRVEVRVRDDDGGEDTTAFNINVTSTQEILFTTSQNEIREDAGPAAFTGRVELVDFDISRPNTIELTSSDVSEIVLPDSVIIPEGQRTIEFPIDVLDDSAIDGSQDVALLAAAGGLASEIVDIVVRDYEPILLEVDSSQLSEAEGNTVRASIEIPFNAPAGGFEVRISDTRNQFVAPERITVPEGRRRVGFDVQARDDFRVEGQHSETLTVTQTGMISGAVALSISDNDVAVFQNPTLAFDVDGNSGVSPRDVLLIIYNINRFGSRELDPTEDLEFFIDVNGNGVLEPTDALLIINAINRGIV